MAKRRHKKYKRLKNNPDFRAWLVLNNITMSELAETIPISKSQLSHWLDIPLTDEMRTELRQAALKILVLRQQEERDLREIEDEENKILAKQP